MKKYISKKIVSFVLLFVILCTIFAQENVWASDPLTNYLTNWPQMTDISEQSAVLMDADNGGILYSLDRDVQRYPASITKILTCLLVIENTNMTDEVTIGEEAMEVAVEGNSNINPVLGEVFTVEQCLYMLMLKSANDIAVQLAIQVAGSVDAFADMMNERAAAIGCTGTHFTNPSGLPDDNHYTTANDMAFIMRECLKNDTFRQIIATWEYTVPATNKTAESRTYENHNRLIDTSSEYYYQYCIGGKTGFTNAAGRTLICVAEKDGRTLIGVTMLGSDRQDFVDMGSLFEYGFNNFIKNETTISDGVTWSYNLPTGMESSLTVSTDINVKDGKEIQNLVYEDKIKVGEQVTDPSVVNAKTEESQSDEIIEDDGISGTESKPETSSKTGSKMRISIIVAAVLAIVALIVIISVIHKMKVEKQRMDEMRRRYETRKRMAERERRREERRRREEE